MNKAVNPPMKKLPPKPKQPAFKP